MMKKRFRVMAALMAMAVMAGSLTGCGGNKNAPAETGSASSGTAAEGNSGGAAGSSEINAAKPAEGMALKEDIVIGMQSKHTTVDAMDASNTQHNYMYRMVYDTPVHFNNTTKELEPSLAEEWSTEDGGKTYIFKLRDGVKFHNGEMVYDTPVHFNNTTKELEPSLAEEWSTEDGGKTYIFKLRDGVKFHNGETLKASDFVFTFNRMEGTTSCNGVFLKVESVEAVDDLTVKMTLVDPNLDWPYMMTLPTASIMNEKAVTDDPEKGPAVGTGPWMVDSYEFGNYTKLVAFEDSWRGAPNAKSFTFRYIPEDSARLIALQNGEIDICQTPAAIELGRIEEDPALDLISYKGGSLTYMAFNTQKDPAKDENLRKAVAHAIDIDSIIAVAAEGRGEKATSFWGWDEFGFYDCGGYTRDLDKAKEYLAKAFPNGNATLDISVGADRKTIAEMIQSQCKEIGLTINIVELDSAGISTTTTNGEHQSCLYGMGFNIFGDDARRILQPGSAVNKAHYDSPEVMELLDKAVAEEDEAKRLDYYKQIQENVYEHVPYIPIYYADGFIGVKKGTGGIDIYPTSHHDFSNIFVPAE